MAAQKAIFHASELMAWADRIAQEFTKRNRDSIALISDFRDLGASAGELLVRAVKQGRLLPPGEEITWLNLYLDPSLVRFESLKMTEPSGASIGLNHLGRGHEQGPRANLGQVAFRITDSMRLPSGKTASGSLGHNGVACLKRFAFAEAATTWFRRLYYPQEMPVELLCCKCEVVRSGFVGEREETIYLPMDQPRSADTPADEMWRQLATLYAYACRELGERFLSCEQISPAPSVTRAVGRLTDSSGDETAQHSNPISPSATASVETTEWTRRRDGAEPFHRLSDTEQTILETLGTDVLTGEQLAKKAEYPFNSNFRSTLSSLRKRGILNNLSPGYQRVQ